MGYINPQEFITSSKSNQGVRDLKIKNLNINIKIGNKTK